MKKRKFILFLMMLGILLSPHRAEARRFHHTPHHAARHHAAGVDSSAGYADIVIEAESGRVIHETDSNSLRHPASLTKMMTLYITFQALESGRLGLGQYLTVSENASYQSPSKLGLRAGQHIRVEDAILGLVTESANDAAVVLGEALGGSEEGFGQLMTRQAHALGMTHTVFYNPSGLPDPDQVTTAHDMAVLGDALINHYPQFYPYFSHDSFTYAGIYHHNHNHLMARYDGMDGIKTGYIRASGFNLVASAKRNGTRLIGVIFGGRSAVARDNSMAQLLDHSFAVAQVEARDGHIVAANGEGDSSDNDNSDYLTLPAKISVIFPSHGGDTAASVPQPQPKPQPVQQAQAPAPVPAQASTGVPVAQPQSQPLASQTPALQPSPSQQMAQVDQAQAQPQPPPVAQPLVSDVQIPQPPPAPSQASPSVPASSVASPQPASKPTPQPDPLLAKVQQKAAEKAAAKAAKAKAKADAKEAEVAKLKAAVEAKAAAKAAAAPKQKVAMLVPPAPPSTASTPDSLNWGIQIGAYSDAAIGAQALSDLTSSMPDQLTGADPQVQKISSGGVPMYRARLMSLDKKTAQSICSYLIQHGKSCLTVEP